MPRNTTIDVVRGMAITLVCVFHVTRGLISKGEMENSPALEFADLWAYGFHVQIFFLLSGFFLYDRLINWRAFAPRAVNLYYPYLLWSVISGLLVIAAPGGANSDVDLRDLLLIPLVPIQHYWFLLSLIFAMALFVFVRGFAEIALIILIILSIAGPMVGLGGPVVQFFYGEAYTASFFLLGAILGRRDLSPCVNVPIFVVVAMISVGSVALSQATGIYIRSMVFFASSLASCWALYCVCVWMGDGRVAAFVARLGVLSMTIYLTHVIFQAGLRTVIYALWAEAPLALVIMAEIAISLAGPLLMYEGARRVGWDRLLGFSPIWRSTTEGKLMAPPEIGAANAPGARNA